MFFTNSYSSHVKRLFVHKICEEIICSRNPWRDYLFTKSVKRLFVHDICHVCHSSLILFSRCFRTCNSNDKKKTKEERPRTVVGHRMWKQGRESEQKIKGHTIPQPHCPYAEEEDQSFRTFPTSDLFFFLFLGCLSIGRKEAKKVRTWKYKTSRSGDHRGNILR